jgi:ABC-type multidrug transport system ATPase subunit
VQLVLENISKSYQENNLFSGINLEIAKNNKLAVIGENGSGKTTLLKIMSGYMKPDKGQIYLQTNDIKSDLTFQNTSFAGIQMHLPLDLSVNELFAFHFMHRKPLVFDYLPIMKEVFPSKNLLLKVGSLSAGWYNRLKLLLALLTTSEIVILDEPFSNLDGDGIVQMQKYITKYSEDRILIVAGNREEEINFCNQRISLQKQPKDKIY